MTRTFLPHVITDDSALGGAVIERSLRFSSSASCKLTRTFGTNTSNLKKTISVWVKRANLGSFQSMFSTTASGYIEGRFQFTNDDKLQYTDRDSGSGTTDIQKITTQKFRDVFGWYHLVLAIDTTDDTADNRIKIYVNGTQITDFSSSTNPTHNYSVSFYRSSADNYIGVNNNSSEYFGGYLADINFIDGQQLDASYFGFTDSQTGMWMPKRYEGTYGNNGFHLDFKDNSSTSTLGKDTSGNQNDFTSSGLSVTLGTADASMIDTPTNNFPTLNPSNRSSGPTLYYGNLYFFYNYKPASKTCRATFRLPKSGKYYWEWENNEASSNPGRWQTGLMNVVNENSQNGVNYDIQGYNDADIISYSFGGSIWFGTTHTSGSWDGTTRSFYRPQRCAWAVDCDTGNVFLGRVADDATTQWWASDGSATGNPSKLLNPTGQIDKDKTHEHLPFISWHDGGAANSTGFAIDVNFGQHAFKGTVPDGFKTLSSANIPPDPTLSTIVRPQRHFQSILYTGNNASGRKITGLEFKPDFVWFKKRSGGGQNHTLYDSVRGAGKRLMLPGQYDEDTVSDELLSFDDGGFTIDVDNFQNENAKDYVAWCWKAGGPAVTNNDGSGTSQVSANVEAGFSIVSYTGNATGSSSSAVWQTIGHGLGGTPEVIIFKSRSWDSGDAHFATYHHKTTDANTDYLVLDTTEARVQTDVNYMGSTLPTSSVFSLGYNFTTNKSGETYIAYCFRSIPGYSKFGKYTGNNNADGPYIHLGFRPAWVMIKNMDASSVEWYILDNKRDTDNPVGQYLSASSSASEATYIFYDFLADGFKLRNTGNAQNPSSATIIYFAFAEQPGTTPFDTFPNAR